MNNDSNKKIYLDSDICKSNNDKTKNTKNIKIDKEHDKDINPSIKFIEEITYIIPLLLGSYEWTVI